MSLRIALIGDAQSTHLLKWGRTLARVPQLELWVASSRGFLPEFDALLPPHRRLALDFNIAPGGGNVALLAALPALGAWLRRVDADWVQAHYLTSHGTLAWLAKRLWRLRGQLIGSAWGSDILVAPAVSPLYRGLTRRVMGACPLCTSDSAHTAQRMRELGAGEVMTFAFGLEKLPPASGPKDPWLFFANRALEPLYRPERVLALFARVARRHPQARLVIANDGSLACTLAGRATALGLTVGSLDRGQQVEFAGRLGETAQATWYARAQWYLSLPESDSVSVSLLEALAHGCIPLLSDLPANREWIRDGENGSIVSDAGSFDPGTLDPLLQRARPIAALNRARIERDGLIAPAVARFLQRVRELTPS